MTIPQASIYFVGLSFAAAVIVVILLKASKCDQRELDRRFKR